jgi:hypothetical protein
MGRTISDPAVKREANLRILRARSSSEQARANAIIVAAAQMVLEGRS